MPIRDIATIERAKKSILGGQSLRNLRVAYTGIDGDSAPTANADSGKIWVRLDNERGPAVQVVNNKVRSDFPNIKVWVGQNPETDEYELDRLHTDVTIQYGDHAPTLNTVIRNGDMLYAERVHPERITSLRMYPGDGLTLGVEPGFYRKPDGTWVGFAGDTIDLTAHVPGTVDEKRLVLIGIVYSTGALTASAQTTVSVYTEPRDKKLFEVADVASYLNSASSTTKWIGAVPLVYGQTHLKWLMQYTALGFLTETLSGQYVAKAGDTMTGPLIIDGTSDAIQLTVQGHSTQTNPVFEVQNSAGNAGVRMYADGRVIINESANNVDFRVEGTSDPNLLFVDASADNVGIGTSLPQDLLSVNAGNIRLTSTAGNDTSYGQLYQESGNALRIESTAGSGFTAFVDINPLPQDGTSNAQLRFFRLTNTTGLVRFVIHKGDGTGTGMHIIGSGSVVFNNNTDDINFQVSGTGDANLLFADAGNDNVGIGTGTPNASAKLDVVSTTGTLMVPRMTTTQRDLLTGAASMIIFNTTTSKLQTHDGTNWVDLH